MQNNLTSNRLKRKRITLPKGDLWVQSPVIIIGNIRSIAENRRRSNEAYRRVMSTWPSMMVGTAEGDLPKLFSLNKGDLSLIFIQRHRLNYFNHTHARARAQARAHAQRVRARVHVFACARARACV